MRLARLHPFRDRLADPAGGLDADGVETGGDEEVAQERRLAQHPASIRREALGTVEERAQADALQDRHALGGERQLTGQMLPVLGQVEELGIVGDLAVGQRPALRLEEADQQLARLLLDVGALVRHAQHRQVAGDVGARLGDDVEVLGRQQRHGHARHAPDLARPQPRTVDHEVGGDCALVGVDAGDAPAGLADARHLRVLEDAHPALAGALGQRLGDVGGIGLAVGGYPQAAGHAGEVEQRKLGARLGRRQHVGLDAPHLAHGRLPLQLLEALARQRQRQRAVLAKAGGQTRLRLQDRQQLGRILGDLGERARAAQLADEAGRMPGGARGQPLALEEHHIAPAELGQVIGDRAADDAPADDDTSRL